VTDSELQIVYDPRLPGLFSVNQRNLYDIFNLNRLSPESREILAVLIFYGPYLTNATIAAATKRKTKIHR
jgi:hypothetical protein